MNWWEVLGVDSSADLNEVRLAYLELLKTNKPEENPEGFKRIRDAFEQAKHRLENPCLLNMQESAANPLDDWIEVYRNFKLRIQPESWQTLISSQREVTDRRIFTQLALGLFEFFLRNPYLPAQVWKLLDEYFGWQNNAERLGDYFSNEAIRYFLYRLQNAKWLPEIDSVKFPEDYSYEQIQTYFYRRDEVYRYLRNGHTNAMELASSLREMLVSVRDEEAFLMLSKLYVRQGQVHFQQEIAEHYLSCFPNSIDAKQVYLQAMCSSGRHSEALDYFLSAFGSNIPNVELLKIAAKAADLAGNTNIAVELHDRVISLCPWDYEASFSRYLIHLKQIQSANDSVLLLIERAEVEVFRGNSAGALKILDVAVKESSGTGRPKSSVGLEKLAFALLRLDAWEQMQELLTPLIETESTNKVFLFCLAEAHRALSKPEKALSLLNQMDPLVPVLWSKSSVLLDLRRYQESLEVCHTLLAQGQADATLFHRMGRCLEGVGNRMDALHQFQKALELGPDDLSCYCAVMDQALALGQADLVQATFQKLITREIATQQVLDYWGLLVHDLDGQAKVGVSK